MSLNKPVRRIAIVGTGVIGASWAAEFLANGFDVVATDPAPNAEQNLRKYIDEAWPALTAKGPSGQTVPLTPKSTASGIRRITVNGYVRMRVRSCKR